MRIILTLGAALALAACQTTANTDADATAGASAPVANPGTWSDPNDSLHDRVHDALMEKMGPAVNAVGVKVTGSKVFLTGSVKTEADRQRAHDIAHGVAGAGNVDVSQLVVKP